MTNLIANIRRSRRTDRTYAYLIVVEDEQGYEKGRYTVGRDERNRFVATYRAGHTVASRVLKDLAARLADLLVLDAARAERIAEQQVEAEVEAGEAEDARVAAAEDALRAKLADADAPRLTKRQREVLARIRATGAEGERTPFVGGREAGRVASAWYRTVQSLVFAGLVRWESEGDARRAWAVEAEADCLADRRREAREAQAVVAKRTEEIEAEATDSFARTPAGRAVERIIRKTPRLAERWADPQRQTNIVESVYQHLPPGDYGRGDVRRLIERLLAEDAEAKRDAEGAVD